MPKKKKKKKVVKKRLVRKVKKGALDALTPAQLKQLQIAARKRQLPMDYLTLSLPEMNLVQQWTAKEGGFQRELSMKQVREVAAFMLYSPAPVVPPVLLARLKGDRSIKRWCIDGQHRLKGAIMAGVPISAVTITVDNLEQARYLFLIYNSKATKISKKFIGLVSNNEVATITRELAEAYDAFYEHIKRLGIGLLGGTTTKYWDEVAHDASIPESMLKKMRLILDLWTNDPRWLPGKFPEERPGEVTRIISRKIVSSCKSAYCVPGVLQVIGAVIRDLNLTTDAQIKTVVEVAQNSLKFKGAKFRDEAARNGMDFWCKQVVVLKNNVAKHALGGSR